jgi:pSer/pThr/pTyr-binding forkhead associated (FHA) protein
VSFATDHKLSAGEFRITAEAVSLRDDRARSAKAVAVEPEPVPVVAPAPAPAPARPRRPEVRGEPVLVLLEDDQPTKTIPIGRRVRIGRQADNDLAVSDPGVSRHHAEIINERGTCTLHDLGSTNGTYVNGSVVTEHALADGDRISLGSTVVEFRRE